LIKISIFGKLLFQSIFTFSVGFEVELFETSALDVTGTIDFLLWFSFCCVSPSVCPIHFEIELIRNSNSNI